MQIVALVLFVNALIVLGLTGTVAYLFRVWPLHELRRQTGPDPRRERRGAWLALGLCALIAGYSTWVCVRLERDNEQAGGFLPTEYHPKGWRWSSANERTFRANRFILDDRPLTPNEQEQFAEWVEKVETLNALHRTVEEALRLYVLVPLALAWLCALAFGRRLPVPARALSVPCAVWLSACGYVVVSRGVYTALMGD